MDQGVDRIVKLCDDKISQLNAVTNNLANINTPGFKFERLYFAAKNEKTKDTFETLLSSPVPYIDYSEGMMQKTDNPLDVAIHGEGFFSIQTKEGVAYTRKGNFTVNKNNQLVTQSGEYVLGESGPLVLNGKNVTIDNEGRIRVDGNDVGKLSIIKFENLKALVRYGNGLFMDPGDSGMKMMEKPSVSSLHLELSNVNAVNEMVEMINIQRSFESYQKVIQMMADFDKLSTSRMGRLA